MRISDWSSDVCSSDLEFFLTAIAARDTVKRGDPHWMAVQFMKTMKIDPEAAALLLETFGDVEPDEIAGVATETLIVCGREDRDNGSPVALADLLPNGRFAEIPGTHMSCVDRKSTRLNSSH